MNVNSMRRHSGALLVALILVTSACSSAATSAPATASPTNLPASIAPTSPPSSASPGPSASAVGDATSAAAAAAASPAWQQVLTAARGQTVNWYLWGGDPLINQYVSGYMNILAQPYGVTIHEVQIADTVDAVNKVLGEKSAGKDSNGSVDLIWINGENFTTMKQANALDCGWVNSLPNSQLVDYTNSEVNTDFGVPIDNCEAPWTLAQFTMIYDSAQVPTPPTDAASLIAWIKANPGKFTYPALPDFTGSVFVRQMLYYTNGGYQDLLGPFSQAKYDAVTPALWQLLNDLKPDLWRQGSTYPQSIDALDSLYGNGEVTWDMTYGPTETTPFVQKGTWPATTRELIFQPSGMIGDVSYVAIPYNSPHKAASQVVANLLLSVQAQYDAIAAGSLGYPAIDMSKLPADQQAKFAAYPLPPEQLPLAGLIKNSNPELDAQWATSIEAGWAKNVLQH
jgi:putative spermidine/putrescine transport system substrate-binding protein